MTLLMMLQAASDNDVYILVCTLQCHAKCHDVETSGQHVHFPVHADIMQNAGMTNVSQHRVVQPLLHGFLLWVEQSSSTITSMAVLHRKMHNC